MYAWLFENPWPIATICGAVAIVAVWRVLQGGGRIPTVVAAVAILSAAAGIATARLVTTPGEEAKAVVEELVRLAENAEPLRALELFAPNAVLNYQRRENQGLAVETIRRALGTLNGVHAIESNRVTRLRFATLDERTGEVELSCSTVTIRSGSVIPTSWIVRVRRDGEGEAARWRIDRLTFESMFGKPPPMNLW